MSDERRFEDMLDRPYGKLGAGAENFSIYATTGNHNWRISREATFAQVEYLDQNPNFTMPNIFYKATLPGREGFVDIFVIDTEMLLASTTVYEDNLDADGREARIESEVETRADNSLPANDPDRHDRPADHLDHTALSASPGRAGAHAALRPVLFVFSR